MYDEEYDDCRSIKARFHQYFIFGKELDCEQWKTDYNNCIKYTKNNDLQAAQELIDSETNRRRERLKVSDYIIFFYLFNAHGNSLPFVLQTCKTT